MRRNRLLGLIAVLALIAGLAFYAENRFWDDSDPKSAPKPSKPFWAKDDPAKNIMCTPKGCCKLVDAEDVIDDQRISEQETLDDESELECVPLSWKPHQTTYYSIP